MKDIKMGILIQGNSFWGNLTGMELGTGLAAVRSMMENGSKESNTVTAAGKLEITSAILESGRKDKLRGRVLHSLLTETDMKGNGLTSKNMAKGRIFLPMETPIEAIMFLDNLTDKESTNGLMGGFMKANM